jgi:hypothetical protein
MSLRGSKITSSRLMIVVVGLVILVALRQAKKVRVAGEREKLAREPNGLGPVVTPAYDLRGGDNR